MHASKGLSQFPPGLFLEAVSATLMHPPNLGIRETRNLSRFQTRGRA